MSGTHTEIGEELVEVYRSIAMGSPRSAKNVDRLREAFHEMGYGEEADPRADLVDITTNVLHHFRDEGIDVDAFLVEAASPLHPDTDQPIGMSDLATQVSAGGSLIDDVRRMAERDGHDWPAILRMADVNLEVEPNGSYPGFDG